MSPPLAEEGRSPSCETCGRDTSRLGKLPCIGLRPLVHVYKCISCNRIMSVEPERQRASSV